MRLAVLLLIGIFAGCGGGGGETPSSQSAPQAPTQPPSQQPPLDVPGVWSGEITYRQQVHSALCRITSNNAFPLQLTCMLVLNGQVVAAFEGDHGALNINPPSTWQASGIVYDSGSTRYPFALVDGVVDASTLTLVFEINGARYSFVGTPAQAPTTAVAYQGVYTSADMRGAISLSISTKDELFGQGGGCTISGSANGLSQFGQFIEVDLKNCGIAPGTYSGFGIVSRTIIVPNSSAGSTMFGFEVHQGAQWIGGYAVK